MFVIMRRYTGNHGCSTQKKDKEMKKKKRKSGNLHHSHGSSKENIVRSGDAGFNMTSTTSENNIDNIV